MAELLTQLQDELYKVCCKFRDCVGVLQQQAPPRAVSTETLLAKSQTPDIDVQLVQSYTKDIIELTKTFDGLCRMLLGDRTACSIQDQVMCSTSTALEARIFESEVRELQQQHQQVTKELATAVKEVERLLQQLQQLYAALAQAKLQALIDVT